MGCSYKTLLCRAWKTINASHHEIASSISPSPPLPARQTLSSGRSSSNQSIEQFLPSPIHTHIHWVCEENFLKRMQDPDHYQPVQQWQHGCEQHVGFTYLAKPIGSLKITRDKKEIRDIGWFDQEEVKDLPTTEAFNVEFEHVFELLAKL